MVYRRKRRRTARKKSFNVSAIELGAALSIANAANLDSAVKQLMAGNLAGGLSTIQTGAMKGKTKIIGTLGAAFVAKMLAKGFGNSTLAKLGPIRIKA